MTVGRPMTRARARERGVQRGTRAEDPVELDAVALPLGERGRLALLPAIRAAASATQERSASMSAGSAK